MNSCEWPPALPLSLSLLSHPSRVREAVAHRRIQQEIRRRVNWNGKERGMVEELKNEKDMRKMNDVCGRETSIIINTDLEEESE